MNDDLIKRSDAIEAIRYKFIGALTSEEREQLIKDIPAVRSKQGKWIKYDKASYRCSECGKIQIADDINELNYCCCCGSKNRIKIKSKRYGKWIKGEK